MMLIRRTLLLSGALGLFTGYLFGRSGLRKEMMHARTAKEAIKALVSYAMEDAVEVAQDFRKRLNIPLINKHAKRAIKIVRVYRPMKFKADRTHRRSVERVAARRKATDQKQLHHAERQQVAVPTA